MLYNKKKLFILNICLLLLIQPLWGAQDFSCQFGPSEERKKFLYTLTCNGVQRPTAVVIAASVHHCQSCIMKNACGNGVRGREPYCLSYDDKENKRLMDEYVKDTDPRRLTKEDENIAAGLNRPQNSKYGLAKQMVDTLASMSFVEREVGFVTAAIGTAVLTFMNNRSGGSLTLARIVCPIPINLGKNSFEKEFLIGLTSKQEKMLQEFIQLQTHSQRQDYLDRHPDLIAIIEQFEKAIEQTNLAKCGSSDCMA